MPLNNRTGTNSIPEPNDSLRLWFRPTWPLILVVFAANFISAALFIHFVDRPAYDDKFNIIDVHMFASQGVNVNTIRGITTPPGPTGFAWLAITVRFLGAEELRNARIGSLLTWVLIVAGVLIGASYSSFPDIWYGALLTSLIFPHSVEAAALVLTEGPALLFAVLGVIAWVELEARPKATSAILALGICGGSLMGLAITCRQYFIALLPAAALLAVRQWQNLGSAKSAGWRSSTILSLAVAAAPVIALAWIWKGFSSPGMAMGTSYPGAQARVGFNFMRPLIAAFYTASYLALLTLPTTLRSKTRFRTQLIVSALLGGILTGCFSRWLLQPGPLRTLVHGVGRGTVLESIIPGVIGALAIYNVAVVALLFWERRAATLACLPLIFALLTVLFFVAEQVGVGGNLPFYDRYVLQVAPFLGIIAFALSPRINLARLLVFASMAGISQVMLWRFAFGAAGS
jgi:hypothetical protein